MNQCQQQQMQQFPQANMACAGNMNFGCQRVNNCCNSFMGQQCHGLNSNNGLSSFAMAGAGPGGSWAMAGNNGGNQFGNSLFKPPYGNNFGGGVSFPPALPGLPMPGLSLSLGVSLNA